MFSKLNDPVSSISHFIGAVASIPITIALVWYGAYYGSIWHIVSFLIFGLSLLALYTASTVYHLIPKKVTTEMVKLKARKIDHK